MIISNSSTYRRDILFTSREEGGKEGGGSYFVEARSADWVEAAEEARADARSPAGGAGGLQVAGGERPGQQGQHPWHLEPLITSQVRVRLSTGENRADTDCPSRRALADQLSTVQRFPPTNNVFIQTDRFYTSLSVTGSSLWCTQTSLSDDCSALQDFLSSDLRLNWTLDLCVMINSHHLQNRRQGRNLSSWKRFTACRQPYTSLL